jgi:hypothetical protein
MPQPERFETLVLGSGNGGMYLAWHTARSGRRTATSRYRSACRKTANEWRASDAHDRRKHKVL